jgi:hypothetical protein
MVVVLSAGADVVVVCADPPVDPVVAEGGAVVSLEQAATPNTAIASPALPISASAIRRFNNR